MLTHNNVKLKNITYNGQKVKKWNHNGVRIYNAGSTVTYYVDTDTVYTEDVDSEASCLSPKTFTPTKSDWEFVGWRENNTASSEILTDKIMGDSPIALYAVFKQDITCTFISNGTQTVKGTKYYNNNNVADASITAPEGQVYSGWTWRGWAGAGVTDADAAVEYANGDTITISGTGDFTFYSLHYRTLTLTYYNGSATASSTTGNQYHNASGTTKEPSFTMTQTGISGWTARGWSTSSAAKADIMHKNGDTITLYDNLTIYGCYQRTLTLSYAGNGATSGSTAAQNGTQYFNSGNYSNPSFTLRANGFARTNYVFSKWAMGSASGTQYAASASVTLSASTTFYAVWKANVADKVLPTIPTVYAGNEVWQAGGESTVRYTFDTKVDRSLYSGVQIYIDSLILESCFSGSYTQLHITDGSASAVVATAYKEYYGTTQDGSARYLTIPLNFNSSSGTATITLNTTSTSGGTAFNMFINYVALTLVGRKG